MLKKTYDLHADWLESELSKIAPNMEWKVKRCDEGMIPTTYRIEASIEVRGHLWVFTWDGNYAPIEDNNMEYLQWIVYKIAHKMVWRLMGIRAESPQVDHFEDALGTEQPRRMNG